MKTVTVTQMRELDRRTIEEHGTPGEVLMDRAGLGVARAVREMADSRGGFSWPVYLFAGKGNNGGDVFVAARYLKEWGADVEVWLAASPESIKGDALTHLKLMNAAGVSLRTMTEENLWEQELAHGAGPAILVDGLLGTGATGAPRGAIGSAIELINDWSGESLVVAVDIPSGINGDTGEAEGVAVAADLTVTMGMPKTGMLNPAAVAFTGPVEVLDIGIPDPYVDAIEGDPDRCLLELQDLKSLLPRRPRESHKGHFGHVLLVGGAKGYAGAVAMAARAAVRSGSGLVTAMVPESIVGIVAGSVLEAMVKGVEETDEGSIASSFTTSLSGSFGSYDALLIGPGLTRGEQVKAIVLAVLEESSIPVVLDADAISVLAGEPEVFHGAGCPLILTPHPGELARLLDTSTGEVQADRYGAAREAAERTGATVILKGAGTLIASSGKAVSMNTTGNPGMATGGCGDVLAGMVVSLLGQGLEPYDAGCLAVYLHGRAGDRAAARGSQAGLIATDLIEELPSALAEVCFR